MSPQPFCATKKPPCRGLPVLYSLFLIVEYLVRDVWVVSYHLHEALGDLLYGRSAHA